MNKITGLICLAVGIGLIVWGYNMAHSAGGQISSAFTGSPGDKPMWCYIGGAVLILAGLGQVVFWKGKS